MVIRSIDLLNHLRCRRYSALHYNYIPKVEMEHEQIEINSVQKEEDQNERITPEISQRTKVLNAFETYYLNQLHLDYTKDVLFSKQFEEETLVTTFDFYQKQPEILYRVSRSSSNHFLKINYTVDHQKYPLFEQSEQGIYTVSKEIPAEESSNYIEKRKRVMSRHYDTGRIVYTMAFSYYVLPDSIKKNQPKFYLALLNSEFSLTEKTLSQMSHPESLFAIFDFTDIILTLQSKIEADLYRMQNLIELKDSSPCDLVENECLWKKDFECEYTEYCFNHIPTENALTDYFFSHLGFREGPHKNDEVHYPFELFNEGKVSMDDIPISWLQREKNLMQRYAFDNDTAVVRKDKIKLYLTKLNYPLYFLDFESYSSPIPRYIGEKPYTQSLFQYSLHVLDKEGGKMKHYEFLAEDEKDHRLALLKSLMSHIYDDDGSVVVYNQTFEKSRLLELSALYPEYEDQVKTIVSRLFDLYNVFKNDSDFYIDNGYEEEAASTYNFYHPKQSGSYSIKKMLKVFGDDSYERLKINHGALASSEYFTMIHSSNKEKKEIKSALLAYCKQDTLSMVILLDKIKDLLIEGEMEK